MSADTLEMTGTNFDTEIATGPTVVDFHATWCGPCKQIAPILDELAVEYKDQGLKIGKVDIDQAQDLAVRFSITSVPTILFFKDGEQIDKLIGGVPRPVIEEKIKAIL